jgi:hypothetical protein
MKPRKKAYQRLAQVLVERSRIQRGKDSELLTERFHRTTSYERRETTAEIEDRIRVLEAAIETRLQLELDKDKRGLLPPYYSRETRKEEDRKDQEEIDNLKAVLLYRKNLSQARQLDRLNKKE